MFTDLASHLHLHSSCHPPQVTIPSLSFLPVVNFHYYIYPGAGTMLVPHSQMVPNSLSSPSPSDCQITFIYLYNERSLSNVAF